MMAVPIPKYLKHIANLKKQRKAWTHFDIQCTCGSTRFWVYQNYLNREEEALVKPHNDALEAIYDQTPKTTTRDENGKLHYWRLFEPFKGLNGRHEEIIVPERPYFSCVTVIKIRCTECGNEHVVFDSRIHGYDGMTGEKVKATMEYEPHFKLKCKAAVSLEIKIENDESFAEFQDHTDLDFTEEQYSDAFGWIVIYQVNDGGKKTKIFDWESA